MMALYESRLKCDTVTHLGGIAAAIRYSAWYDAWIADDRYRLEFLCFPEYCIERMLAGTPASLS